MSGYPLEFHGMTRRYDNGDGRKMTDVERYVEQCSASSENKNKGIEIAPSVNCDFSDGGNFGSFGSDFSGGGGNFGGGGASARVVTDAPEKIVAFPGYSVPVNLAEPNEAVVDLLERLLANAKIGMIRSIGVAVIDHEEKRQTSWCGDAKRSLLGYAIATLNHGYLTAVQREDEADD